MIIKKSKSLLKNSDKHNQIDKNGDPIKVDSRSNVRWNVIVDFTKIQKGGVKLADLLTKF